MTVQLLTKMNREMMGDREALPPPRPYTEVRLMIHATFASTSRSYYVMVSNMMYSCSQQLLLQYNIFFQIEREYILQNRLEVTPALPADEVFTTSDPNYEGPELPPRYSGLVLPSDWYVPGKGRRKKRQHVGEFLSR